MIDENVHSVEVGVYSFTYRGVRWIWDQRTEMLSLNYNKTKGMGITDASTFIFRLRSFTLFEESFWKQLARGKLTLTQLEHAFARLLPEFPMAWDSPLKQQALRQALGRLAFFILCFTLKHHVRRQGWLAKMSRKEFTQSNDVIDLMGTAEAVLEWLGPDGADTAWRDRYSKVLDYERRYQLLDIGRIALGQGHGRKEAGESLLNLTEYDLLVALWWTTRCQCELADEWYQHEGHRNPKARRALLDASSFYLQILKDEPRKQALQQFLDMIGTDPEREVARIFQVRSKSRRKCLVAEDEAARRAFTDWFLVRYSIWRAFRLESLLGASRQITFAVISLLLGVAAIAVFLGEGPILLKISLQIVSLILMVALAPSLFRLMLPRALFGSLIAWLTIVLAQSFEVFPAHDLEKIESSSNVAMGAVADGQAHGYARAVCHRWLAEPFVGRVHWIQDFHRFVALRPVALGERTAGGQGITVPVPAFLVSLDVWTQRISFVAVVIGILLISLVFILNEVNRRILRGAVLRSVGSLSIMVLGALFWGITFANPIRILIEGGLRSESCNCIKGIWILGSVVAVLFGLLVQVLTEERPLAVPAEESA
jgi:hypothetical protein